MRYWASDILDTVVDMSSVLDIRGIKICKVKSINPFVFIYKDVEMGSTFGDTVYVHPLSLSGLINYDESELSASQNFNSTTAYNSPNFTGAIEGTIPDFIKNFYLFYKEKEKIYLLKEGDLIAIYELGGNSYLVLQKVIADKFVEDKENK